MNAGNVLNIPAVKAIHGLVNSKQADAARYVYRMDRFDLKVSSLNEILDEHGEMRPVQYSSHSNPTIMSTSPASQLDRFERETMNPVGRASHQVWRKPTQAESLACQGKPPPSAVLNCPPPWSDHFLRQLRTPSGFHALSTCHLSQKYSWAAGDFVLGHRAFWQVSTGYPNVYGIGGVDSLLMCRVAGACFAPVFIGADTTSGCGMLHMPHERRPPAVHHQSMPEELNGHRKLLTLDYCMAELYGLRGVTPLQIDARQNWGLARVAFNQSIQRGKFRGSPRARHATST